MELHPRLHPPSMPLALALACACGLSLAPPAIAQQVPDTTFDTRVPHPAYTEAHPAVLFDEAHHNFHTSTGRYRAFADLVRHDGYAVTPNAAPFSAERLQGFRVLVIANALGAENMQDSAASRPAFTDAECRAVLDWVSRGGALLLIADHAPMGAAASALAAVFGVDMRNAVTVDSTPARHAEDMMSLLVFTKENGGLADHPILRGRDTSEAVSRVMAFTGQSLAGPDSAALLLRLSDSATDVIAPNLPAAATSTERRSAAGRAQGLALIRGRGRVVVLGEAAMLSAQWAGPRQRPMGMNHPGNDNRRFALNLMHWLTGIL